VEAAGDFMSASFYRRRDGDASISPKAAGNPDDVPDWPARSAGKYTFTGAIENPLPKILRVGAQV
jgi:hypothetical protein